MKAIRINQKLLRVAITTISVLALSVLLTSSVFAQGSIFGTVTNSDLSTPANGDMTFIGYLDDTDEEIRIETSTGAGYDAGFWYDDFQNYLTEAAGNPYDYHFFNVVNGEGYVLSELIPINSFQQEDVELSPVVWPLTPLNLTGWTVSASKVLLGWSGVPDHTYHVYRRTAPSAGSFFRIDDTTGALTNPGISGNYYVDTTVDGISDYHYLIIAEDTLGNLSPHSATITVSSGQIERPKIISITPETGPSYGGTAVTIIGEGFDMAGATATIGGSELASPVIVSPFEITGETPGGTGPADVVVTNTASGLPSTPLSGGFFYLPKTPPVISEMPDQALMGDGTFAAINLDDYVEDLDHPDSVLTWSHSGDNQLSVEITDRIATITISAPEWSGREAIKFRATDTDFLYDEETVTFVQVKVTVADPDFSDVIVGRPDSISFTIGTPDNFTVLSPQFTPSNVSVMIRRGDGGDIADSIPPASEVEFWAIWIPSDTTDSPGSITISSISTDDNEQIDLLGRALELELTPAFASYDFGDVNSVDIRAADTIRFNAEVGGNIGGKILSVVAKNAPDDFDVLLPSVGDSLQTGSTLEFVILSHPQLNAFTTADVWVRFSMQTADAVVTDSIALLDVNATGVEPGCMIVQDTIDFSKREVGTVHEQPLTISNSSTVYNVIDSIYVDIQSDIFWIDSSIQWPLFVPPGDLELAVFFHPQYEATFTAEVVVVDSVVTGDCNPPVVRGIGIPDEIHWEPDDPITFGLLELCNTGRLLDYGIHGRFSGFDLIIDNILIDSSAWFGFYPGLETVIGSTYSPLDNIRFDSIIFTPQDILPSTDLKMTIVYHVDTAGALSDFLVFDLVTQTGGCAGRLDQLPDISYDSITVGTVVSDTIVLMNYGACNLLIETYTLNNDDFSVINFPSMLAAGEQYDLEVTYNPMDTGLSEGRLTIYHNGYISPYNPDSDCPLENQTVVNLTGIGIDFSAPQISNVVASECGQVLDIVVFDIGVGVESVSTTWRKGNAVGGFVSTSNSPQKIAANHWELQFNTDDLSADSINFLGYEIEVYITDGAGNADTSIRSIAGCIPGDIDGGGKISGEKWLGGNGFDSLWHLVSFPGSLPSYRVSTIFEQVSNLPPTNNVSGDAWRLYEYRNTGFNALVTEDQAAVIEPGRGYWFRHIMALDTMYLDNTGAAATWPTLSPFVISLDYGWNLIGSPFLFPVSINDTLIDPDSLSSFLRQAGPALPGGTDWWEISDIGSPLPQLQPWQGYAVWCENPAGYSIFLDPHYLPQQEPWSLADGWIGSIKLSTSAGIIGAVDFGTCLHSSEGPDITDIRSVAFFRETSRFSIDSEHGSFIRDLRPDAGLQIWNLDISSGNGQPMIFSWSLPANPESDRKTILYDAVTGNMVDMSIQSNCRIENPQQLPEGRFVIFYGDGDAIKAAIDDKAPALPLTSRLYQNYPNPFNPETTISYDLPGAGEVKIRVYNILGQRVNTLVDKYHEAGSYQVCWNGRDNRDQRVASGIYLVRLTTDGYSSTIKMSLLK